MSSMQDSNAEAGPSSHPLFLKPKLAHPHPPPLLASTQDLLARLQLLPAYDKYVRSPLDDAQEPNGSVANGKVDNGKGKARDTSPPPQTPGAAGEADADDDDGAQPKGEKKKKSNSYRHLIKGVPGKHSMKKDDYLAGIMQVPPKQRLHIAPFDLKTQREAFSVSLEGLKGWNIGTLVQESAQAREDRKKRVRVAVSKSSSASPAHSSTPHRPSPPALLFPHPPPQRQPPAPPRPFPPTGTGTPRPAAAGTPRASSTAAATPRPVGTPTASARPSLPPVVVPQQRVGTPVRTAGTGTPTSAHPRTPHPLSAAPLSAGVKREREDTPHAGTPTNTTNTAGMNAMATNTANANGARPPVPAISAAKAGIAGARPRPLKKQRTDIQGHARDVTVQQQPTPQGV
ncbi:hypothetical protein MSAN_00371200 [Mycena sanguinolenta]|uniref:Uncharacterized protein n=1 Tax=Mycena sanguinolenta TaxID=230812 RepID=A0A8H6ZC04_9AGAR|nr:hypothetical protein MSAN_00371200 [Mycena sanguinolenta]